MAYRKRESRRMKHKVFSKTADKKNLTNIRLRQPRGGRCE